MKKPFAVIDTLLEGSRHLWVSILKEIGENDAAESVRTGGKSDRQLLANAGLVGPGVAERLAAALIPELLRLSALAWKCCSNGHATSKLIGVELERRPADEVLRCAEEWSRSPDMGDRSNLTIVGLYIGLEEAQRISWRLDGKKPCPDAVAEQIEGLDSNDEHLIGVCCGALQKRLVRPYDQRLLARLTKCERHRHQQVRVWYVGLFEKPETANEFETLIRMTTDVDGQIRLLAVVALANSDADTAAIRDALARALNNDDFDERNLRVVAISGLLRRNDPRVIAAIEHELKSGPDFLLSNYGEYEHICDLVTDHPRRRYVRELERWRDEIWENPDAFDAEAAEPAIEAIRACRASSAI